MIEIHICIRKGAFAPFFSFKNYMPYLLQCHNLRRACQHTLTTFQTVGIKKAYFLPAAVVGRELHRTYTGATHTFHLTCTRYVDVREGLGERFLLRSHPARDRTHRAERAPSAWRIDETQRNADNGSNHNNSPKNAANATPHSQSTLVPRNS